VAIELLQKLSKLNLSQLRLTDAQKALLISMNEETFLELIDINFDLGVRLLTLRHWHDKNTNIHIYINLIRQITQLQEIPLSILTFNSIAELAQPTLRRLTTGWFFDEQIQAEQLISLLPYFCTKELEFTCSYKNDDECSEQGSLMCCAIASRRYDIVSILLDKYKVDINLLLLKFNCITRAINSGWDYNKINKILWQNPLLDI
jgi:hypothetical protein